MRGIRGDAAYRQSPDVVQRHRLVSTQTAVFRCHRDQAETERKNRDRQTLTIKRKIVETLATAEDFRAAGMLEEARLADQLADSLEARL